MAVVISEDPLSSFLCVTVKGHLGEGEIFGLGDSPVLLIPQILDLRDG